MIVTIFESSAFLGTFFVAGVAFAGGAAFFVGAGAFLEGTGFDFAADFGACFFKGTITGAVFLALPEASRAFLVGAGAGLVAVRPRFAEAGLAAIFFFVATILLIIYYY
jgi:hypothetical protein